MSLKPIFNYKAKQIIKIKKVQANWAGRGSQLCLEYGVILAE